MSAHVQWNTLHVGVVYVNLNDIIPTAMRYNMRGLVPKLDR